MCIKNTYVNFIKLRVVVFVITLNNLNMKEELKVNLQFLCLQR